LDRLEDVATFLQANMSTQGVNLGLARWYADTYASNAGDDETAVDVGDLLYVLRYITTNTVLQNRIDNLLTILNGMIIRRYCGLWHKYATGVSLFFPEDEQTYQDASAEYADTSFATDYSWDEMLEDYYDFVSNYTPNISVYDVDSSGTTVSPSNPVTVTGYVEGDGISDVYFIPIKTVGTKLYVYDYRRIDNPRTLPNGKTIEKWSTSSVWSVSQQWNAKVLGIADNTNADFMFYDEEEGYYVVYGEYTPDDGATWFDAEAYFNSSGVLVGMVAYVGGFPIDFEPTTTTEWFRPTHAYIDTVTFELEYESSSLALKALELRLGWVNVDSGSYILFFFAFDIFENEDCDGVGVTVP